MKKIFRKISVFVVVFLLFTLMSVGVVYADSNTINVRIEGSNDTLFNKKVSVTDEVYGIDILETALGEAGEPGSGKNIEGTVSQYGLFINTILGETPGSGVDYSGSWGLYTVKDGNISSSPTGISSLKINNLDEILYHSRALDYSWNDLTLIPNINITTSDNMCNITVNKSVYNTETGEYENVPIENAKVEVSYKEDLFTDSTGKASFEIGNGIQDITVSKTGEYPEILRQHFTVEGDSSSQIKNAVEDLKGYYKKSGEYSAVEAIALNHISEYAGELEDINLRYTNKEGNSASDCAKNIIGSIAAGKDYSTWVDKLIDNQNEDGKFVIVQNDDCSTIQAFCILALDMAGVNYDKNSAVNTLVETQNDNNSFGIYDGEDSYGDVDSTAMVIMALANHRDLDGVEECINTSLEYIKSKQGQNGGFISRGAESPYSTAAAIQGLIAVGEDPLSQEWTVDNGKNPLDFLMTFKTVDHFEYTSAYGTDVEMVTEQAFAALADLYKGSSMYQEVRYVEKEVNNENLTMERVGSGAFNKGEEAHLQVNIENGTAESKEVTLLIALYDTNNNKMVNYTYLTKTIAVDKAENIAGGFLIPQSGDYAVRAFLWDNLEDQNALTQPIDVSVE